MRSISLFILLSFISFLSKGQNKVWKKQVSRVIDTRTAHSHHSPIARAIINAVRSGKVTVYDPVYFNFPEKMSDYAVRQQVFDRIDTFSIVDPIDGHEVTVLQKHQLHVDSIHMYRIMEEWTFNPATGKISIQIKYIAPMLDVMGDDAILRGKKLLFWIGFNDFSDALQKSKNAKKQEHIFYTSLWQSYFESSHTKRNTETVSWHGYAKSLIKVTQPRDTVEHFLRDEKVDSSLGMVIANEFENGKLPIWSDQGALFSRQLTQREFISLTMPYADTQTLIDPVDRHEVVKISKRNFMKGLSDYYILQYWGFDAKTGKTEIGINGIAPILETYYSDDIPRTSKFWIRYSDMQPLLNRIEQYHPTNTFAMHIWDSYFLSDTKPVLEK